MVFSLLLCLATLCACSTNGSSKSQTPTDGSIAQIDVPFEDSTIRIDWGTSLFTEPADQYNNDLAIAGLVMSAAANNSQDRVEEVYGLLGFECIVSKDYSSKYDLTTSQPACTMGVQKISVEGEARALVSVTVRGTTDYGDVITDATALFDGVLSSAKYVYSEIDEYMDTVIPGADDDQIVLFVNGHSLGGGVANLLGQATIKGYPSTKCFDYTYAPVRTVDLGGGAGVNIMNVINTSDSVPGYPNWSALWGGSSDTIHVHVGQAFEFSGQDESLLAYYAKLTGNSSLPPYPPDDAAGKVSEIGDMSHGNHDPDIYMAYLMLLDSSVDWTSRIFRDGEDAQAETETQAQTEPEAQAEPEAEETADISGFVLEGTWESVGSEGFGQAQPGATVTFDGQHANFFSPYDTYSYYQNDSGGLTLEATSFLTNVTLYFTIDVESDDLVYVTYIGEGGSYQGGSVTTLERVS